MYKIGDEGGLYRSLPPNMILDKKKLRAFCLAFDRKMGKLSEMMNKLIVWGDVDNVDPKYYDALASCLDAPYYRADYDNAKKLDIIKSAVMKRRYAGTKKAMKQLVKTIYDNGKFEPWYEYGGKPYHFKITANSLATYVQMSIKDTKAARSVLDYVETILGIKAKELFYAKADAETDVLVRQSLNENKDIRNPETAISFPTVERCINVRSGLDLDTTAKGAAETAISNAAVERCINVKSGLNTDTGIKATEYAAGNVDSAREINIRSNLSGVLSIDNTLANIGTIDVSINAEAKGGKDA